jgi:hypothetical protein
MGDEAMLRGNLKARLKEEARAIRSDTRWIRQAKYGLLFHWTSQSQPRHGRKKPHEEAVRDFPVESFAEMVNETGANWIQPQGSREIYR